MANDLWPLFDLRIVTPRLELRYIDDEMAMTLARLAANGVHDPACMPFAIPWTDVESPELERNALQWYWRCRAELSPSKWNIMLAVIDRGVVVGTTDVGATDFLIVRQFETGSWLGREFQGQGIGKEMRAAALHLGFAGLGAAYATTGAWVDNAASRGVTASLGYEPEGRRRMIRRGEAVEMQGYRMSREQWEHTIRRDDIEIVGLEPALPLLGL
jgi:RimJ/RimL family protein N-acetyltransferase